MGISNIFKIGHHLLKVRVSNKGIKQMLLPNFQTSLAQFSKFPDISGYTQS